MYYLPFDRLMGLWIINEFLKQYKEAQSSCHNNKEFII